MAGLVKVLFAFEDTPTARRTLAAAMEDPAWEDKSKRPVLEVGFGMVEQEALFILSKALGQHGARVLVVAAPKVQAKDEVSVVEKPKPEAAKPTKRDVPVKKEDK